MPSGDPGAQGRAGGVASLTGVSVGELIADATDGPDVPRGLRIVADLPPETRHVDVNHVIVSKPVLSPDPLEELRPGRRVCVELPDVRRQRLGWASKAQDASEGLIAVNDVPVLERV